MSSFTRAAFARRILAVGKWPPHANNHAALVAWMEAEGTAAKYNPLATTRAEPGATDFNSVGVKNYTSFEQGVKATVDTIKNGRYADVITCLKSHMAATTTLKAVTASPWGTHVPEESTFVDAIRADWSKYAFKPIPGGKA